MTTNVYDAQAKLLTSDARWSSQKKDGTGQLIAYIDDTGYDKIAYNKDKGLVFLLAGDLERIAVWKKWVDDGCIKDQRPLHLLKERLQIIQVGIVDGKINPSHQFPRSGFGVAIKAMFAGTGADAAKICWDANKCARKAVASAILDDPASGGTTIYFDRVSKQNNIRNSVSSEDVVKQLKTEGTIMEKSTRNFVMSVQEAAKGPMDTEAYELASQILSGSVPLSAPFPGMDIPLTDEQIRAFDEGLVEYLD